MWVFLALAGLVVSAWFGVAWLGKLLTKYEHTVESRLVFSSAALLSLYVGWRAVRHAAPSWGTLPAIGAALLYGFAMFCLISFAAMKLWLAVLTRPEDEKIERIEDEEDRLLRKLETLRWQAAQRPLSTSRAETPRPDRDAGRSEDSKASGEEDDDSALRRFVATWEQEGGAARIRSLKVSEWRDEASKMTDAELAALTNRAGATEPSMPNVAGPGTNEQQKVRRALYVLEINSRVSAKVAGARSQSEAAGTPATRVRSTAPMPGPTPGPVQGPTTESSQEEQMAMRQRLQEVHKEIQMARSEKSQLLRGKIKLTWRRQA